MDIMTYTNDKYKIDTVIVDGDIYFRGDQAGYALGYKNPGKAINSHCDQEGIKKISTSTAGGNQYINYISEGNLYSLAARSRLPQAKDFKKWVFNNVITSVRRTGMYAIDEIIDNPELAIKALTALMEERNKTKMLEKELEISVPKIEFYEAITGSDDSVHMSGVAKLLNVEGMGRNNLFLYLRGKSILRYNNEPYQEYVNRGYFDVVESHYIANGEDKIRLTTKVTPKGQEFILKILRKDGYDTCNKISQEREVVCAEDVAYKSN